MSKYSGNSNNMRPLTIPKGGDNLKPVSAFDLSISDLNERRRRRLKLESVQAAAQYFGIESRKRVETIIKNKTRVERDGKFYALRLEDEQFDKDLTVKT